MIEFIKCIYLITYNIISNTIKSILNMVIKIGKSLVVDGDTLSWWDGKKSISTSYGRGNVNIQIGNCSVTSGDPVVNISVEGDAGDVNNVAGDVNVSGNCKTIKTTSGDIKAGNVNGGVSSISGDIEISGNVGGDVKTTSGDITADGISGNASSMSGDVNIKQKTKTVIKEVIKESPEKQNNEIA